MLSATSPAGPASVTLRRNPRSPGVPDSLVGRVRGDRGLRRVELTHAEVSLFERIVLARWRRPRTLSIASEGELIRIASRIGELGRQPRVTSKRVALSSVRVKRVDVGRSLAHRPSEVRFVCDEPSERMVRVPERLHDAIARPRASRGEIRPLLGLEALWLVHRSIERFVRSRRDDAGANAPRATDDRTRPQSTDERLHADDGVLGAVVVRATNDVGAAELATDLRGAGLVPIVPPDGADAHADRPTRATAKTFRPPAAFLAWIQSSLSIS